MSPNTNNREMTSKEKREIKKLVVAWCANYDKAEKECLPLETGCYMFTKYFTGGFCRYFQKAVSPLNPMLESILLGKAIPLQKSCIACGKRFVAKSNSQKYCSEKCATQAEREKSRKRMAEMRKRKEDSVTK